MDPSTALKYLLTFLALSLVRLAFPPSSLNAVMATLKEYTVSASIPASTSPALSIPIPSFLAASSFAASWIYTTAVIIFSLLALEQTVYRWKKQQLPGDRWTIPLIGKFADSLKPTMEGYMKQWNSGALSAISVFNM